MVRELKPGDSLSIDHLAQETNAAYNAARAAATAGGVDFRDEPAVVVVRGSLGAELRVVSVEFDPERGAVITLE